MTSTIQKGVAPKGWHIANGKELERVQSELVSKGLISIHRYRLPKGSPRPPDNGHWIEYIVKDKR